MTSITLNVLPAVRAWIIAVLAAEQITTTVICGGRLGAGHGWPARMSESYAGTARTFFNYFSKQLIRIDHRHELQATRPAIRQVRL